MNVFSVMERLTEPEFVASPVKTLSRAEIARLQLQGEITPLNKIPDRHMKGREVIPAGWDRGCYDRSRQCR